LYLSETESERNNVHYTEEQANALTLATLSKKSQLIVDYSFNSALGNNNSNGLKINSQNFTHVLNARYGLTDNIQIGGTIQYSDNKTEMSLGKHKTILNSNDRAYNLYANHRFKIDDFGKTNLIVGLNTSYAETNNIFGAGLNFVGYQNTDFAQFILGGSLGKEFSHNQFANDSLPDYFYSGFIGANKPLFNRYLASITFAVNDATSKNTIQFDRSYSVSTGLTYVLNRKFQISPSFAYSFGASEVFSFGMNIAYVGGW
jgi:hypothetical protein